MAQRRRRARSAAAGGAAAPPTDPALLAALAAVPSTLATVSLMLPAGVLFELIDTVVARLRRKHRLG